MDNFTTYYDAAESALANYFGIDDINEDTVNLVADCARQAVAALPDWNYFQSLLEKSSSYVQTDMTEDELAGYVGELEEQLEEYGLV
jgi:hypothetical protein